MAVLDNDIVADQICAFGGYDPIPLRHIEMAVPKNARVLLDIGAHAGWYTLLFAMRGWRVEAFEPMPTNNALLEATMCRYPRLKDRIRIHRVALGPTDRADGCRAYSEATNAGDAMICCPEDDCEGIGSGYVYRGQVPVRTLDSLLDDLAVRPGSVGFVKIDVEGYECGVLQGATQFLSRARPFLIQSEVCTYRETSQCPPKAYLMRYKQAGYVVYGGYGFGSELFDFDGPEIPKKTAYNFYMELPGTWVQNRSGSQDASA